MAYLGLVPSESSSGVKEQRGVITRAGNVRLRRLLIEAAWHYRHWPGVSYRLRERRKAKPARVIAIADRAQYRLHTRLRTLAGARQGVQQDHRRRRPRARGLCMGDPESKGHPLHGVKTPTKEVEHEDGSRERSRLGGTRDRAMRRESSALGTRDTRRRLPPDGARSCGSTLWPTRAYQSDSWSKIRLSRLPPPARSGREQTRQRT